MFEENFVSITPVNFFQIESACAYIPRLKGKLFSFAEMEKKKLQEYLLPDTSALCAEDPFAKVYMGWNEEGIELLLEIDASFNSPAWPDLQRGDSVELFFDTRDLKSSGFNTRFCHHFFFFAEALEGRTAGELSKFRTEDTHSLCDPAELKVKSVCQKSTCRLHLFIPANCLHGYEPAQFNRLGFTYRLNRTGVLAQHFSVVSEDYPIEQHSSLWASLKLHKNSLN